jgi:hypothetical protein
VFEQMLPLTPQLKTRLERKPEHLCRNINPTQPDDLLKFVSANLLKGTIAGLNCHIEAPYGL